MYSRISISAKTVSLLYAGAGAESISDICFSVRRGQTVGIIGGTGSGKSTLVHLIPRFYDATEGSIRLNGCPIQDFPHEILCRKIGIVPQRALLFQGSIRENMKWGNEHASDEALWQALTCAQAREIVENKPDKLDFHLEQNGRNLSGGQKQRLTIARALVKNPQLLILDDSSSALDFATDAALRKSIRNLGDSVTTFLVSQRIAAVRQADKILVLDNGTLVGIGTHEQLLRDCPVYQGIYESQFPEESKKEREDA